MHKCKIMHRDFKSLNVLIDKNDNVKVIDFGESKEIDPHSIKKDYEYLDVPRDEMSSNFSSGTPDVGTKPFMAPEMITKSISSPAMDLWGLGCILY